jgi:hypothetical protein
MTCFSVRPHHCEAVKNLRTPGLIVLYKIVSDVNITEGEL